jgi:predicted nucleic acid-binding Zn ribbon protein
MTHCIVCGTACDERTCSDRCTAVAWGKDPDDIRQVRAALWNEKRRRMREWERRWEPPITCVVCRKPYRPEPTEHNVHTHPGECRRALERERWRRAAEKKARRRQGIDKG